MNEIAISLKIRKRNETLKNKKELYQEIHGNQRKKFHLPKDQVEPYNPYCEVQMHQLLSNKQHALQVIDPVKLDCNNSESTFSIHQFNAKFDRVKI